MWRDFNPWLTTKGHDSVLSGEWTEVVSRSRLCHPVQFSQFYLAKQNTLHASDTQVQFRRVNHHTLSHLLCLFLNPEPQKTLPSCKKGCQWRKTFRVPKRTFPAPCLMQIRADGGLDPMSGVAPPLNSIHGKTHGMEIRRWLSFSLMAKLVTPGLSSISLQLDTSYFCF